MNHYDPETGIKIESIDKDVLTLFHLIIKQNEMILRLNEEILQAFAVPRFLHRQPDMEEIRKHFK